jgi:hypothetical protein
MCDVGHMYLACILTVLFFGLFGIAGTMSRYFTGVFIFLFIYTLYSYVDVFIYCNVGFTNILSAYVNLVFIILLLLNIAGGILSWRNAET